MIVYSNLLHCHKVMSIMLDCQFTVTELFCLNTGLSATAYYTSVPLVTVSQY